MIAAVDTNVLLDILVPDARFADDSERKLSEAVHSGPVVLSEPVYAELAAHFPSAADLTRFIDDTGMRPQPSSTAALERAGEAWRQYTRRRPEGLVCAQCGAASTIDCPQCRAPLRVRQHVLADFLIGAHASVHADRLITRDRGYYRTYFPELELT